MCLQAKTICPSIAETEIVTYKVLKSYRRKLMTPYQNYPIPRIPYRLVAEGKADGSVFPDREYCFHIGKGYIHSCQTKKRANAVLELASASIIAQCHIPIGTKYFIGYGGDICSKELILDEIVHINKRIKVYEPTYKCSCSATC